MSKVFKNISSNIAESLLVKLPDPTIKFNLETLSNIKNNSKEKVFKLMENID